MNFIEPKWYRLTELRDDVRLVQGSVFIFPSLHPFDDYMLFMLCGHPPYFSKPFMLGLTGRKSGNHYGELPDSKLLTAKWMVSNWKTHIYQDCEPLDVFYCENLPSPSYPIHLRLRHLLDPENNSIISDDLI